MHSGYEIPGIQQHQQPPPENNPVLLSMNQTHFLDQIHTLPAATQHRLFLDQPHFLPPHYVGGPPPASYFPAAVNFKLGLNEICGGSNYRDGINDERDGGDSNNNNNNSNNLRGSEQYNAPEARRSSSLGMLHCWQNQPDSPSKQPPPPFWEHLPPEVSNENSEIIDRSQEMNNQKEQDAADDDNDHRHLTTCLVDTKSRLHFGDELEVIYRRLDQNNQTGPSENNLPEDPARLPAEASEDASASLRLLSDSKRKRKKRKRENSDGQCLISPMADFFGSLVKQVMDHQESMHAKFAQVIERLEEERRAREEEWRKQELVRLEQESEARAREKALAKNREAMIVSCLEKITGERINFCSFVRGEIVRTSTGGEEVMIERF